MKKIGVYQIENFLNLSKMVLFFTLAQPSGPQWPFSTNHPFFWDNLYILNSCSAEKVSTTQLKSKIRYPIGLLYINNNYHGIIIYLIVNLIFYCIQFIWQYFFFFQDKSNEGMSDSVAVLQDNRKIIPKMSMTYILQISNIFENLCLLLKNFC